MKERFYAIIWMWELVLCYFRRWLFSKYDFTHNKQTLNSQNESLVIKWAITLWKRYLPSKSFETQITQYSDCFVQLLILIIQLGFFCCILKLSTGYYRHAAFLFLDSNLQSPTVRTEWRSYRKAGALRQWQLTKPIWLRTEQVGGSTPWKARVVRYSDCYMACYTAANSCRELAGLMYTYIWDNARNFSWEGALEY